MAATKKPKNPKEAKLKYFSPDGNYKTKITKKYGEPEKVKETRTLKGVLRGVNKPTVTKEEPKTEPKLYQAKKGGSKNKNWIQKATASIKRRGTAGKCTPITKKSCTGKAKTLALTFKKMAKNR
jgi:hypothetical protein